MKSKKILIGIAAVAMLSMMIANVYAPLVAVPTPPDCGCPGFTPGFWKHNITVYLARQADPDSYPATAYSAFEGDPLDGVKLTDAMMLSLLNAIRAHEGGIPTLTFEQALAYLKLPGWSTDRTNIANWFNHVAGYGYYED